MSRSKPVTMLVFYYPRKGKNSELLSLIKNHWPTLDGEGLVSKMPAQIWRATDKRTNQIYFAEMFQWKDDKASRIAHHSPGVMAIWEPMGAVLEVMEIAQIEPIRFPRNRHSVLRPQGGGWSLIPGK
jgi:hypothetical protein